MTPIERAATRALAKCKFQPGIMTKKFAMDMAARADDYELTPRQEAFLWRACWTFRRQLPPELVNVAILMREAQPKVPSVMTGPPVFGQRQRLNGSPV